MKGKKGNTPRRHHYVPQGYLYQFADERQQVHVYCKDTGKTFSTSPLNIAQQRNFYAWRDGQALDVQVETALANQYDNHLATLLRIVPAALQHVPTLAVAQLDPLLRTFTALQLVRTPRIRRQLFQRARQEVGLPGVTLSETQLSTGAHLQMLTGQLIPQMAEHFGTLHPGLLVSPPETFFLTSDHPVCTCLETGEGGKVIVTASQGLGRKGFQLVYPLTPRVAYTLTQSRMRLPPHRVVSLVSPAIQAINTLTWHNAEAQVYSARSFEDPGVRQAGHVHSLPTE
ncbi:MULTISPECIES: DUF4238 domain-containing protein [Deinococcus]|uniref:DUF4238 domain-containing protein n=1 Tax=Deinococcus rufus TaxID=2136097 RepID=A0ABV7Z9E1_9DEIO|nr:DUF4238 domain-containing protein [Deinococcus sp. AB2017081]WQE97154.1 DUF4238 domain-containing protein [Deinococcus sp. AB2017081]